MTTFKIMGPRGSQSARAIARGCDITLISHTARGTFNADFLINYGILGHKLVNLYNSRPFLRDIPTINSAATLNKLAAIRVAEDVGVNVPLSSESCSVDYEQFIWKPYYSRGGRGIIRATEDMVGRRKEGGYFQKYIENRAYELRVLGAKWIPRGEWQVWKRLPGADTTPDTIAWNHEQGGTFQRVNNPVGFRIFREAIDATARMLEGMGLQFGAADFAVSGDPRVLHFLELNRRPGFTEEYGGEHYFTLFNTLKAMSVEEVTDMMLAPWDNGAVPEVEEDEEQETHRYVDNLDGQAYTDLINGIATVIEEWELTHHMSVDMSTFDIVDAIIDEGIAQRIGG